MRTERTEELLDALDIFLEATAITTKDRRLAKTVTALTVAMAKAFDQQGAAFVKKLASIKGAWPVQEARGLSAVEATRDWTWDWEPLFTEAELASLQAFTQPLDEFTQAALFTGAKAAIADMEAGISFDLKNPRAVEYLKGHALEAAKQINGTTKEYLKTIVTQATEEGWSYQRTAKAIIARYEEFAAPVPQLHLKNRAERIAVWEAGEAYETGGHAVAQELADAGLTMEKGWLSVKDSRTSALCRGNEAEGWIPLDQAFSSGHQHPQGHLSCRCCGQQRRKPSQ